MIPSLQSPVHYGKYLSLSQLEKLSQSVLSISDSNGTNGLEFETGATGSRLVDQNPKKILAIIGASSSSSSSDSSSSDTTFFAYDWKAAYWTIENGDYVAKESTDDSGYPRGTVENVPAVEANLNQDVPEGAVVELTPAFALGKAFYYFFYAADASSDQQFSFEIDCDNGTITVGDPPTTSSKISSSGGGTGVTPKPNGGGGPGVVDNTGNGGLP